MFGLEPMEGWDDFWPIGISVVDCWILPKECPIVLVWITVLLLIEESSYVVVVFWYPEQDNMPELWRGEGCPTRITTLDSGKPSPRLRVSALMF